MKYYQLIYYQDRNAKLDVNIHKTVSNTDSDNQNNLNIKNNSLIIPKEAIKDKTTHSN